MLRFKLLLFCKNTEKIKYKNNKMIAINWIPSLLMVAFNPPNRTYVSVKNKIIDAEIQILSPEI